MDENDDRNVGWLSDEIEWLEGRYRSIEDGETLYPGAERVGRGGSGRNPRKNSVERMHVIEVWKAFCWVLKNRQLYTFQQIVTMLLRSSSLPTYDIIAIDEAQDLNILHIELFKRFMADGGRLLIAGDEGQRLYTKDFTWKEVDSRIRSTTLPLSVNMRNPAAIRSFANLLDSDLPAVSEVVPNAENVAQVRRESKEGTVKYVKELAGREGETTVIVTADVGAWESLLRDAGVFTETSKDYSASGETIRMRSGGVRPGVYCFTQFKAKGLEFDNVIVDYSDEGDMRDERRERRIRYMQFTRARKTLLVRYEGEAPRLLKKYYPDYLDGSI